MGLQPCRKPSRAEASPVTAAAKAVLRVSPAAAQVPAEVAALPAALRASRVRRFALCDFLTRAFGAAVARAGADARAQAGGWHGEARARPAGR